MDLLKKKDKKSSGKSFHKESKMKNEKKKARKVKKNPEPQYYTSATNMRTLNYKVYYMQPLEKIGYFLLAFIVGAAVGYLFYGGLARDEFGQATTTTYILDIVISVVFGLIAGKAFLPIRVEQIINKRRRQLSQQFRDMLDGLTTSLGAGNNIIDSFYSVKEDMKLQYEEGSFILQELDVIIAGIQNSVSVEEMLEDFGNRSGIPDIKSFGEVFNVSYRKGGNIQDVIRNTHAILNDKMEIREDIETVVTSNKMEQNLMLVMPVILIAMIKGMSSDFAANFATATGVLSTTVAIGMFAAAYYIGKRILDIKI